MQLVTAMIKDFAYAGQGRGLTEDGKKILVWDCLPGEIVKAQIFGNRSNMIESVAKEIIKSSPDRIKPIEDHYFISSPWQILKYEKELEYKIKIAREIFKEKAGVELSDLKITANNEIYHYRNSMEYGIVLDSDELKLTQLARGRKRRVIVPGTKLAYLMVDKTAYQVLKQLKKENINNANHIHIRASRADDAMAIVYDSENKVIYNYGPDNIKEMILGKTLFTGPENFFQINPGCFELAVSRIKEFCENNDEIIDYFGGVGTIAIALADKIKQATIVESNPNCTKFAEINIKENSLNNIEVITARSESALDNIVSNKTIILNPPREGLHKTLVEKMIQEKPNKIIYLSCKPFTQARDIKPLLGYYKLQHIELFNFFPRTPHVESLVILERN